MKEPKYQHNRQHDEKLEIKLEYRVDLYILNTDKVSADFSRHVRIAKLKACSQSRFVKLKDSQR